jgi:hypothetical protein
VRRLVLPVVAISALVVVLAGFVAMPAFANDDDPHPCEAAANTCTPTTETTVPEVTTTVPATVPDTTTPEPECCPVEPETPAHVSELPDVPPPAVAVVTGPTFTG